LILYTTAIQLCWGADTIKDTDIPCDPKYSKYTWLVDYCDNKTNLLIDNDCD